MKKILCMIAAALLLLTSACADGYQSITDMTEPERWTADYQVGKNTVTVDVQPTIPDVDAMPVLKVVPSFWQPQPEDGAAWTLVTERVAEGSFLLWTGNVYTVDALGFVYAPFDDNENFIKGSELTLAQMKTKVNDIFATMENADYGYTTDYIHYLNRHTSKESYACFMSFFQALREVPLWGHAIDSVNKAADNDLWFNPHFILTMQDGDNYELLGSTVKETAVLAEDIPLCGFDKVKATAEEQIKAGHIRAVYAIDLGYALYNEPGVTRAPGYEWMYTAEFYAVPAWRVLCLYTSDANKKLNESTYANPGTSLYYESLYINAQTGELLDPEQRGNGTADYAGFISWEDAQ